MISAKNMPTMNCATIFMKNLAYALQYYTEGYQHYTI